MAVARAIVVGEVRVGEPAGPSAQDVGRLRRVQEIVRRVVAEPEVGRIDLRERQFECGVLPQTDARAPFPIKYYLVAVLFIVFDIEVAFLYPWAVSFGTLGVVGYVAMLVFLAVLGVGLYYEVKKRVLEWK